MEQSLTQNMRMAHHVNTLTGDLPYRGTIFSNAIQEVWRNTTVGAVAHIEDQNDIDRIIRALTNVAQSRNTESALEAILKAMEVILQHQWGRLYVISQGKMVSKKSFGFSDVKDANYFDAGKIQLSPREETTHETWRCIEEERPILFCWKASLPTNATYKTRQGLTAINIVDPQCPERLKKQPNDFWIDFPLIANKKQLGKITLSCDEDSFPEKLEILIILADLTSQLLTSFEKRDLERRKREDWIQEAAEQSIAITAHNLGTRLGSLSFILQSYRDLEATIGSLKPQNDNFEKRLESILQIIKRSKERLTLVTPRLERFDLAAKVCEEFKGALQENTWVCTPMHDFEIEGDPLLLGTALNEMLGNSISMSKGALQIHFVLDRIMHVDDEWVRLIYRDNGPGIPDNFKSKIFETFFSSRPGQRSGTGLGLTFVQRVIAAHGGTIIENGVCGTGVQFVMEFPQKKQSSRKEIEHV